MFILILNSYSLNTLRITDNIFGKKCPLAAVSTYSPAKSSVRPQYTQRKWLFALNANVSMLMPTVAMLTW